MQFSRFGLAVPWFSFLVAGAMVLQPVRSARAEAEAGPDPAELNVFGQAVVALLKTQTAATFATNVSVTPADWQTLVTTNLSPSEAERLKSFAASTAASPQRVAAAAQAVLDRANALHLDFSHDDLSFQLMVSGHLGKMYVSQPVSAALSLPYLDKLEVIITRSAGTNPPGAGQYRLTLRELEKLSTGWRLAGNNNSILWAEFPTNVADAQTLRELTLIQKLAAYQPITSADDPALLPLGAALIRFIRTGDTDAYKNDLLLNSDLIWGMLQKSGHPGPTRPELDAEVAKQTEEQLAVAAKVPALMKAAGIDLRDAEIRIKAATLGNCRSEGGSGSLDVLDGGQFKLVLAVKTDAKARNGTSLSGEYVLGVKQLMKLDGVWKVEADVHWETLPEGVVDAATTANLAFESYVAQYRRLPPGMAAPEIQFTTLAGEKPMKLSDLHGKVVLLDFWATWCGPCQQPMADLQGIRASHPGWQDRVAIVPVSIDDTLDIVRKHVDQHGWTNTFNVWAGAGGWHAETAQAFRVTAVPATYIIDAHGKIIWSGYPDEGTLAHIVDTELSR